jgi:hypothetical protein
MAIDLYDVAHDIIEELNAQADPKDEKVDIWSKIVSQVSERNSFDASYCEFIEKAISDYLNKLNDDAKRQFWTETETGLSSDIDAQDFLIDSIEMDLEMELLDEITRHACDEADR